MTYTCTKTFDCVSTAHRNWRAKDNPNRDSKKCAYIHGYTKTFTIVFGCNSLDEFKWVYDYGTTSTGGERTMTKIKKFINETIDHAVTTDDQDPMLAKLYEMHELELIKLVVIPVENGQSGSVEGLCRFIYNMFDPSLRKETNNRVWIESVSISEHHKNSSTYTRDNNIEMTPNQETINAINEDVDGSKSYKNVSDLFKDLNKQDDKNFESSIIDNILSSDNLKIAINILKANPKYRMFAELLSTMDEKAIKSLILKNSSLFDSMKK